MKIQMGMSSERMLQVGRDMEAKEGAREFCVKDMGSEMCARAVRPPH